MCAIIFILNWKFDHTIDGSSLVIVSLKNNKSSFFYSDINMHIYIQTRNIKNNTNAFFKLMYSNAI